MPRRPKRQLHKDSDEEQKKTNQQTQLNNTSNQASSSNDSNNNDIKNNGQQNQNNTDNNLNGRNNNSQNSNNPQNSADEVANDRDQKTDPNGEDKNNEKNINANGEVKGDQEVNPNGEKENEVDPNGEQKVKGDGSKDDDQDKKKKRKTARRLARLPKDSANVAKGLIIAKGLNDARNGLRAVQSKAENSWLGRRVHDLQNMCADAGKKLGQAKHAINKATKDFTHDPVKATKNFLHTAKDKTVAVAKGVTHKVGEAAASVTHKVSTFVGSVSKTAGAAIAKGAATMSTHAIATGATTIALMTGTGVATTTYLMNHYKGGDEGELCTAKPLTPSELLADGANGSATSGTAGYNEDNAKQLFDFLVQHEGFSGAGAAGAVGNAIQESNCNPKACNPSNDVAGIFQWSGFNGNQNGSRITATGKIKAGDVSTLTMENELELTDYELNHGYHEAKLQVGKATDPTEAAHLWCGPLFEGAAGQDEDKREANAREIYKKFNGDSIKANESMLGQGGSNDGLAAANDQTAAIQNALACGNASGNATGAQPDGSGAIKEKATGYTSYNWDKIPDDMKKYVHDPKKAGMAWGSPSGWFNYGGQCVHFSSSYFHNIWKGSPKVMVDVGGNSADMWAKAMGGKVTNTPAAGAIASVPPYSDPKVVGSGSQGQYGHTFIVSHVLANGDFIGIEQNYPPNSGDDIGKPGTWDVCLVSKEEYQKYKFKFFTPDPKKYKLNWGD